MSIIPATQDPHQTNRSTADAISLTMHTILTHLEKRGQLWQNSMQSFHLNSWPSCPTLASLLRCARIIPAPSSWTHALLKAVNSQFYSPCSHMTVLLPSHDNIIIEFGDDTVIGLITGGGEAAYRPRHMEWCQQPYTEHQQDQGDGCASENININHCWGGEGGSFWVYISVRI